MSTMSSNTLIQWQTLHGSTCWEGLIDPLDGLLRRSIIHYGELAEVTYDAFVSDESSRLAGGCLYQKHNLLSKTGVENASFYRVTRFLYATSCVTNFSRATASRVTAFLSSRYCPLSREGWSKESNWMGYVAVATDAGKVALGRRDIVVAWRGTKEPIEWMMDLQFFMDSGSNLLSSLLNEGEDVKIHHGWLSIYTSRDQRSIFNKKSSARDQVLDELKMLVEQYKDENLSITTTGHSLGAALSTLSAIDIVANVTNKLKAEAGKGVPVTAIVFGSPRVGDTEFQEVFKRTEDLRLLRIKNSPDIIPHLPLHCPFLERYEDVGVELSIDTRKSHYLKSPGNPRSWHNLEVYLHGIAGTQGVHCDKFKLEVDRNISLVNKYLDALKDEFHVPPSWMVRKNSDLLVS